MPPLEHLGPADLRRVVEAFRDALRSHQEELNRLNVYPVPDGDTGTNMALTLESVCAELRTAESMSEVCTAIARGSLMGARGNSGVITSQILRGLSEVCGPLDAVGPAELTTAMRRAADAAYEAVMRPVEGTILTVVRETAEGMEAARSDGVDALLPLLEAAAAAARAAVLRTPELLPALAEAHVVDSGGTGFSLLVAACGRSGESHSTDLIRATESGSSDEVGRLLASGVDPNQRSSLGLTALFAAVRIGSVDKVKLLVDAGDVGVGFRKLLLKPRAFRRDIDMARAEVAAALFAAELNANLPTGKVTAADAPVKAPVSEAPPAVAP